MKMFTKKKRGKLKSLSLAVFLLFSVNSMFSNSIVQTNTPPTIDGTIDDIWSNAPEFQINKNVPAAGQADLPAGKWRAMYDSNNFYFLIEINDGNRWGNSAANNHWNGDAAEVYIESSGGNKNQIGYSYAKDGNGNPLRYGDYQGGNVKMVDTSSGYLLEISLPKSQFGLGSLTAGNNLKMEVGVNQGANGGRYAQAVTFNASDAHHSNSTNYTNVPLVAEIPDVSIKALGGKTNLHSNGTNFAALVLEGTGSKVGEVLSMMWQVKKTGSSEFENYTGKNDNNNNIRPTAAGVYRCEVQNINGEFFYSNEIVITANASPRNTPDNGNLTTSLPIFVVYTGDNNFPTCNLNEHGGCYPSKDKIACDVKVIWDENGGPNSLSSMADNSKVYYDRKARMNYRGSTSRSMAKRSFAFSTCKKDLLNGEIEKGKFDMFGLPEEKDWILYAAYVDKSMMRNKLAMDLYNGMGHYASSMRYVELFVNDEYQGVYIFMEKYERSGNRINVTKEATNANPEDIGYIIKFDKVDKSDLGSVSWRRKGLVNLGGMQCGAPNGCGEDRPDADDVQGWELVYPEVASDNDARKNYIRNWLKDFETALYNANSDYDNVFQNYVDVQSFVDFMIIEELARNTDGYRASMWFTKDVGGKLKCTPIWDFEMGFGNDQYFPNNPPYATENIWQYNSNKNETHFPLPFWWEKLMQSQCFKNIWRTRWEELRKNVLSDGNIQANIDNDFTLLSTTVAGSDNSPMGRNKERWSWNVINGCNYAYNYCPWMIVNWPAGYVPGFGGGKTTSFSTQEVPILKEWTRKRLAWIDSQIINDNFGTVLTAEEIKSCSFSEDDEPLPTVDDLGSYSQSICSGSSFLAVTPTGIADEFNWSASETGSVAGYIASGTGTIPSQSLAGDGTVTYTVTPVTNGIQGTPASFTITVLPTPKVEDLSIYSTEIKSGTSFQTVTPTGFADTFEWNAEVTEGSVTGFTESGSGDITGETLYGDGTLRYTVTPVITSANVECRNGVSSSFTIVVDDSPVNNSSIESVNRDIRITANDKTVIIQSTNKEKLTSVYLYDINGTLLYQKDDINTSYHEIALSMNNKLIIVKAVSENAYKNQKVLIK